MLRMKLDAKRLANVDDVSVRVWTAVGDSPRRVAGTLVMTAVEWHQLTSVLIAAGATWPGRFECACGSLPEIGPDPFDEDCCGGVAADACPNTWPEQEVVGKNVEGIDNGPWRATAGRSAGDQRTKPGTDHV